MSLKRCPGGRRRSFRFWRSGARRAVADTGRAIDGERRGADAEAAAADKRWHALTRAKKADEARALCTPWLTSPSKRLAAEGHKCLANVELIGGYKVRAGSGVGGGGCRAATPALASIARSIT